MLFNIEIKAKVNDVEALKERAQQLSGKKPEVIRQEDIFFRVPHGRLKLRKLGDTNSELIFYVRNDFEGPKMSQYSKAQMPHSRELEQTLSAALGIVGTVKKQRLLYMVEQTRVHVDDVQGLGHFMELEVMLKEGQSCEDGQKIAEDLMEKLGVCKEDLVPGAYMDLLQERTRGT